MHVRHGTGCTCQIMSYVIDNITNTNKERSMHASPYQKMRVCLCVPSTSICLWIYLSYKQHIHTYIYIYAYAHTHTHTHTTDTYLEAIILAVVGVTRILSIPRKPAHSRDMTGCNILVPSSLLPTTTHLYDLYICLWKHSQLHHDMYLI